MSNVRLYKSGDIYGKLMLTGKSYTVKRKDKYLRYVEAICECNDAIGWYIFLNLKRGNTKSCGCHHKSVITTHGMVNHPIRAAWESMKVRCYKEDSEPYPEYGGRGIKMCDEWLNSFYFFKEWSFQNGWGKGLTLDRINNDGNYEPLNCRWTTNYIQSRNKRSNKNYEIDGEIKCLKDWINDSRCSIKHYGSVEKRLKKGWSIKDSIFEPPTTYNKNHIYK